MSRWIWLILVIGLSGCATIQIDSDYDSSADFAALHSYNWLPAPQIKSGDPEIQYNSMLATRVRKAVDEQLVQKGFVLKSEQPDFLVTYNAAVDEKVSVTYLNELYGYRRGWGWDTRSSFRYRDYPGPGAVATEYKQGTLIRDVVRATDKQLIWRGSATAEVYEDSTPEQREQRLRKAVQMILERFPPSAK
jgi:hypothetical protein